MSDTAAPQPIWAPVQRFLMSTPKRNFIAIPLLVIVFELIVLGQLSFNLLGSVPGLALMVGGFLLYKLVGAYRLGIAKGSPGMSQGMPERLVTEGPYKYTRNPMYLGHLLFLLGLAMTTLSWLALLILIGNLFWFHQRVLMDEARLKEAFGSSYTAYKAKVKRWIPYVY